VKGKIVVFGTVAVLVAGLWFALGRNDGQAGPRTRFREWNPPK
jgi:hypothetical protein